MRVLHGPVNIGNQPWVLSRHERKLGVAQRAGRQLLDLVRLSGRQGLSKAGSRSLGSMLRRFTFAMSSPWRFDVLHYYFGRSFLCWEDYGPPKPFWFLDLKLAAEAGPQDLHDHAGLRRAAQRRVLGTQSPHAVSRGAVSRRRIAVPASMHGGAI